MIDNRPDDRATGSQGDDLVGSAAALNELADAMTALSHVGAHYPHIFLQSLFDYLLARGPAPCRTDEFCRRIAACLDGRVWLRPDKARSLKRTAALIRQMVGQRDQIVRLAVAPDRASFVSGGSTGQISLWDAVSGQLKAQANVSFPVRAAAYCPDGTLLALAGGESTRGTVPHCGLCLVDASNLHLIHQFSDRDLSYRLVTAIAWSGNGTLLACGRADSDEILVFCSVDWSARQRLPIRGSSARALAFACADTKLFVGSSEGYLTRWRRDPESDFDDFEVSRRLASPITAISAAPQSDLLTVVFGKNVSVYNAKAEFFGVSRACDAMVLDAFFLPPSEEHLAVLTEEGVEIWDADLVRFVGTIALGAKSTAAAVSPDGKHLITSNTFRQVQLWNLRGLLEAALASTSTVTVGSLTCAALDVEGSRAAWATSDGKVRAVDLKSEAILLDKSVKGTAAQLAFSGATEGLLAVRNSVETCTVIWNLSVAEHEMSCGYQVASCCALLPGGDYLVIAERWLQFWSAGTGALRAFFLDREGAYPSALKISRDGRYLCVAGTDSLLQVYELASLCDQIAGVGLTRFYSQEVAREGAAELCLHPVPIVIPSLWPPSGLGTLYPRKGVAPDLFDTAGVSHFDVDENTSTAVIVDQLRSEGIHLRDFHDLLTIWDLREGQCRGGVIFSELGNLTAVAMSPSGRLFAAGTGDGWVKIWRTVDVNGEWKEHTPWAAFLAGVRVQSLAFGADDQHLFVIDDAHSTPDGSRAYPLRVCGVALALSDDSPLLDDEPTP